MKKGKTVAEQAFEDMKPLKDLLIKAKKPNKEGYVSPGVFMTSDDGTKVPFTPSASSLTGATVTTGGSSGTFSYDPTTASHTHIVSPGTASPYISPSTPFTTAPPYYPSTGYYEPTEETPKTSSDLLEIISKTKLELIEDILDDLDTCKTVTDVVSIIAKLQRKADRLKGSPIE